MSLFLLDRISIPRNIAVVLCLSFYTGLSYADPNLRSYEIPIIEVDSDRNEIAYDVKGQAVSRNGYSAFDIQYHVTSAKRMASMKVTQVPGTGENATNITASHEDVVILINEKIIGLPPVYLQPVVSLTKLAQDMLVDEINDNLENTIVDIYAVPTSEADPNAKMRQQCIRIKNLFTMPKEIYFDMNKESSCPDSKLLFDGKPEIEWNG